MSEQVICGYCNKHDCAINAARAAATDALDKVHEFLKQNKGDICESALSLRTYANEIAEILENNNTGFVHRRKK